MIDGLGDTFDQVDVENIGESYLNQRIQVLRLKHPETTYDKDTSYNKGLHHFLVIEGIHGRERVNPKLLIKQIEYYAENNLIPKNMIIHYIPLANADG